MTHDVLFLNRQTSRHEVTASLLTLKADLPHIPIVNHLFTCYFNNVLTWNDFFQFVLFHCLCPMSCFFYLCLYTINAYDGFVRIGIIQQILKLAGNKKDISEKIIDLFTKLDLYIIYIIVYLCRNKDGVLNLRQFFTLLDKNFQIIEPLFAFRERLLDYCFTDNSYRVIFRRKLQYPNTKAYMKTHNNELPSLSCIDQLMNMFTGTPHPMKFDYEDELGTISFSKITQIMIRKYRPDSEEVKKRAGNHYLGLFKDYIVTREIDCFYLQLNKSNEKENSYHKDSNATSYASSYSVAATSPATNTLLSVGNGGFGGRKISILKTPSYVRKDTFHHSASSMSLSTNNDTSNANYLKRKITLNNLQAINSPKQKPKGLSVVAETFLQQGEEE